MVSATLYVLDRNRNNYLSYSQHRTDECTKNALDDTQTSARPQKSLHAQPNWRGIASYVLKISFGVIWCDQLYAVHKNFVNSKIIPVYTHSGRAGAAMASQSCSPEARGGAAILISTRGGSNHCNALKRV